MVSVEGWMNLLTQIDCLYEKISLFVHRYMHIFIIREFTSIHASGELVKISNLGYSVGGFSSLLKNKQFRVKSVGLLLQLSCLNSD